MVASSVGRLITGGMLLDLVRNGLLALAWKCKVFRWSVLSMLCRQLILAMAGGASLVVRVLSWTSCLTSTCF